MITYTKTGRTRHRVYKPMFGDHVLILQVEIHRKGYVLDFNMLSTDYDDFVWRDATVQDISEQPK